MGGAPGGGSAEWAVRGERGWRSKARVTKKIVGTFVGICGSKGRLICLISVSYRYYSVVPIAFYIRSLADPTPRGTPTKQKVIRKGRTQVPSEINQSNQYWLHSGYDQQQLFLIGPHSVSHCQLAQSTRSKYRQGLLSQLGLSRKD